METGNKALGSDAAIAGPNVRRINWWKLGFFIALLAFEIARETAVVAIANSEALPKPAVRKLVSQAENDIYAEGSWRRTDGGDPIFPNIVTITCSRERSTCRVSEVVITDDRVSPPTITTVPAQFDGGSVRYEMRGGCVHYFVNIDSAIGSATSIRTLLPNDEQTPIIDCDFAEERIEMELADGYDRSEGSNDGLPEGFFLPLMRLTRWLFA